MIPPTTRRARSHSTLPHVAVYRSTAAAMPGSTRRDGVTSWCAASARR
ncbi:hypothetical protein ACPEIF_20180 [Streptomyces sp. NPDC012600]